MPDAVSIFHQPFSVCISETVLSVNYAFTREGCTVLIPNYIENAPLRSPYLMFAACPNKTTVNLLSRSLGAVKFELGKTNTIIASDIHSSYFASAQPLVDDNSRPCAGIPIRYLWAARTLQLKTAAQILTLLLSIHRRNWLLPHSVAQQVHTELFLLVAVPGMRAARIYVCEHARMR
jgi:hypothetical protein